MVNTYRNIYAEICVKIHKMCHIKRTVVVECFAEAFNRALCIPEMYKEIGVNSDSNLVMSATYVSCNGSDQEGFVSFCDGQYEICSYQVISKEVAMTALMDYYLNSVRSNSIQWDQLY